MSAEFTPVDHEQRRRIAESLEENLFVEAGAGTGKTTALVSRVVALVKSGRATIDRIAAITFTEAAAAELRDRVRQKLEETAMDVACAEAERERCSEAALGMDSAAIQTLHSFAGSLLRERPIEAGLPPVFETIEEIEAGLRFEEEWDQWLDGALEREDLAPAFRRALRLGMRIENLRQVAKAFHQNYDLLVTPFPMEPYAPGRAAQALLGAMPRISGLITLARDSRDDPLAAHAATVISLAERLEAVGTGTESALAMLARSSKLSTRDGNQKNWDRDPDSGQNGCKALKDLLSELESERSWEFEAARRAALLPLLEELRRFTLERARERRRNGAAEFHDLLVWARDLLRDSPQARQHFQQRFSYILIDEFQDTDPIQAEIAFFLSSQDSSDGSGEAGLDWSRLCPLPGKIFVVGDPKQSIYRFRRADIAALETVRGILGDCHVPLVQNFRSMEPIISWCNTVFSRWMIRDDPSLQAGYVALEACWTPDHETSALGVYHLGGPLENNAPQVRRQEARAVASVLTRISSEPWKVRDASGGLREARYQDVCILLPARTGLRDLENALEAARIPYRIESQSLVLGTQDVRELLNGLRAIDSPADQVALVAALRSSAFGCSDVELLEFVDAGGRLDYLNPGKASGPVSEALEVLHAYHQKIMWHAPDELIEDFVRDRRMVEACFARPRPRERWRRIRFIVERARAFAHVGGSSLRAFLDWMERQAEEEARMVEVPVPETDEDAVRIMTVHASKGLEFPIVILAGLGREVGGASFRPVIFDRRRGSVEVRIGPANGPSFSTADYEEARQLETRAEEAEGVRLMYVAATRARDHLVISLFHPAKRNSHASFIFGLASELDLGWTPIDPAGVGTASRPPGQEQPDGDHGDAPLDRQQWQETRQALMETASRPAAWAVTGLAHVEKEEAEGGETPYRHGRAGTSLGRAVHSVLQTVDLETGGGLEDTSRAQAAAEGIPDRWQEVARLARRGLESSVVKRAVASGGYHREVFVSTHLADTLVEGFIDLLFEDDGGFVIADYKTDVLDSEASRKSAAGRYELQAGLYALAVEQVTGKSVREVVLAFVHEGVEQSFSDIPSLVARAQAEAAQVLAR